MLFDTSTEVNEFATSVLGLEAWEIKFTVRILAYVFNPELVQLYAKGASRLVERTNVAESDDTDGRLIVHHPFDLHNLTTPVKRSDQNISARTMLWIDWGVELGTGERFEELYDVSLDLRPENITFCSRLMVSRHCSTQNGDAN
eukprot:41010_1